MKRRFHVAALGVAICAGLCASVAAGAQQAHGHDEVGPASCFDATRYVEIYSDRSWADRWPAEQPFDNFRIHAYQCINKDGESVVQVEFRQHDFAASFPLHDGAKLYVRIIDDERPLIAVVYGTEGVDPEDNPFDNYIFDIATSELLGSSMSSDIISVEEIRLLAGEWPG